MRLTFELLEGLGAGSQRMTDGAAPFTIGTEPGVAWRLSTDAGGEARLSVRRAGDGFVAEVSGNVLIEGHPVAEGHEVAIHHGTTLMLGVNKLRARVDQSGFDKAGGATDIFADPATPTISAILSDVTPGGDDALGPLPGRGGEEWLENLVAQNPDTSPRNANWDQLGSYGSASEANNRDIQETLPSHPENEPITQTLLPEDWNNDFQASDRFEQIAAPNEGLALAGGTSDKPSPTKQNLTHEHAVLKPLHDALGLYEGEVDAPAVAQLANTGQALRVALEGLIRVEETTERVLNDLDIDAPDQHVSTRAALDPVTLLSDPAGLLAEALSARIARITLTQAVLTKTLTEALVGARADLAPQTITQQVAVTRGVAGRLRPSAEAWREYCTRWSSHGAPLDPGTLSQALQDALNDSLERQDT